MYVVVPCIRFGHVFPLSVDLLDVEFLDRGHRFAILEAAQGFPPRIESVAVEARVARESGLQRFFQLRPEAKKKRPHRIAHRAP